MSIEKLLRRQAERQAAGASQVYPEHRGRLPSQTLTRVTGSPPVRIALPCEHAEPLTGAERNRLGLDHARTWNRCTHPDRPMGKEIVCPCQGCGPSCKGYSKFEVAAPLRTGDPACGVVIGSFRWPELVEMQIRSVRETCGPVPILISNDRPESHTELSAICAAHPDVDLDTNPIHIGHTGGDLAAFYKGVLWGAKRGLQGVAKLSQRFFLLKPYWLQDEFAKLHQSGLGVSTRECTGDLGAPRYPLRSEAVLLSVPDWNRSEVLDRIKPQEYWSQREGGLPAEVVIQELVRDCFGGLYWPWSLIPTDRTDPGTDLIWHNSHTLSDYKRLAERYGVRLSESFHVGGWERDLARGEYKFG